MAETKDQIASTLRGDLITALSLKENSTDKDIVSKITDLQTMVDILEDENAKLKSPTAAGQVKLGKDDLLKMTLVSRPEIAEVYMAKDKSHYHLRDPKSENYTTVSREDILKK